MFIKMHLTIRFVIHMYATINNFLFCSSLHLEWSNCGCHHIVLMHAQTANILLSFSFFFLWIWFVSSTLMHIMLLAINDHKHTEWRAKIKIKYIVETKKKQIINAIYMYFVVIKLWTIRCFSSNCSLIYFMTNAGSLWSIGISSFSKK